MPCFPCAGPMVFQFCPYSSLGLGLLSGKIDPEREFTGDDLRKNNPRFSVSNRQKVRALMEEIRPIASAHKATGSQIVIAWTLQQPGITFALCGARNPGQAVENAAAGRLKLSSSEIEWVLAQGSKHLVALDV